MSSKQRARKSNTESNHTMATGKRWAELHPKDGDTIVHCGHLDADVHHSWYAPGMWFVRPDGTAGKANFVIACGDCYQRAKGDSMKLNIVGDATWVGDEPYFEAPDPEKSPYLH